MAPLDERKPLLSSPLAAANGVVLTKDPSTHEPPVDAKAEFLTLASIALQVSLATFVRIGLYSVDYAFLGHLGTSELAAASLASVWTAVPLLTCWSGMSAIVTLSGQAWGAGNGKLAGVWLQMGLMLTNIVTLPLMVYYWFFVESGMRVSTDDEDVIQLGVRFARIVSFSVWPNLTYVCLRLYFQALGIMMPTTVVGTLTMMVSIVGNYVFIYGFLGVIPAMGFDGSPLSTVVASWFQPIALAGYCVWYKGLHKRAWGGWDLREFTRDRMLIYARNSVPASINSLVSNLASSVLALIAASLGSNIIAANAIVSGYWRLMWALFWGFGTGTQIRVSNLMGANRPEAAKMLAKLGFAATIVVVAILASITFAMREDVYRLYTNDSELLAICLTILPIFVVAFIIESMEMVMAAVLMAMGQVHITALTSTIATWCIELPIAYVFSITLGYGFPALWYSIWLMELTKFAVYLTVLRRTDFAAMARLAVRNMEAEPTLEEDDDEALKKAIAGSGLSALGAVSGSLSPMAAPLVTPKGLMTPRQQWERSTQEDSAV
jgi:MATE family multidrug resistance protein